MFRKILPILVFASIIYPQQPWLPLSTNIPGNLYSVHFNNSNTGWTAGDYGVISKTTDGGISWDYQYPVVKEEITAIVPHQYVNATMFAGGKQGMLFRSTNSGELWTDLEFKDSRTVRGIHFISSTTGFIYGDSALLKKTTNGGLNWSNVQSGISTIDVYGIASTNEGILIAVGRNGYILRSTNQGVSWSLVNSGVSGNLYGVLYNHHNTNLWICGEGGVILRSTNQGLNWIPQSTGVQSALRAVVFNSSSQGWTVGDNSSILNTTDGGTTWSQINVPVQSNFSSIGITGTVILVCGDGGALLYSNNSGSSWVVERTNELHKHNIISIHGYTGKIFVGGNYGHFYTKGLAAPQYDNWKKQPLFINVAFNMVKTLNDTIGIAVGYSGSGSAIRGLIAKTTNGGLQWDTIPSPTPLRIFSVEMRDANNYWITASNSTGDGVNKLYFTTNGGSAWTEKPFPIPAGVYIRKIHFTSQQKAYCSTTGDKILFTTNGGGSWGYRTAPVPFAAVDFVDDWEIRAIAVKNANSNPIHYLSADGGTTWNSSFYSTSGKYMTGIKYVRYNHTVLIGEGGAVEVFYPVSGLSSMNLKLYPYHNLYDLCFPDSSIGYIVGGNGVIYKTYAAGLPVEFKSFTAEYTAGKVVLKWSTATELNNRGFEVQRKLAESGIEVGNSWATVAFLRGAGTSTEPHNYEYADEPATGYKYAYRIKQTDYDGKFSYSDLVEVYIPTVNSVELEPNFPNPFTGNTTITYSLPHSGYYRASVLNVNGEEIYVFSDGIMESGQYKVMWDASGVSSGVYYFIVRGSGYKAGIKMLLLR
ncbi:MAG: hypothetical protein HUU54_08670 [Ignavibacteriaceae bacterium]|nr:hypothetical protein [Ignavibacteriaceae bacterium]